MTSMITGVQALPNPNSKDGISKPIQEPEIAKIENIPIPEEKPLEKAEIQPEPLTGCDAVRTEVSKYPGWDVNTMVAISQAESSCRYDALGDTTLKYSHNGREYGYSVSAFQVRILPGREHCDTYDLRVNVECAYRIWQGQGLSAWSMYSNGKYLKFL